MENINLFYGDGFAGRSYYMTINEVRIEICLNNGDIEQAKKRTLEIFKALNINYSQEIQFDYDGRM